jgi:hypothetical protein
VHHSSDALSVNPGFDGDSDPNTIDGSDVIPVGGSATITLSLAVSPGGRYTAEVAADGTSPIGTVVTDSASASFAVFAFDIKPSTLETKSRGLLPAVLFGSEQLAVSDVDLASIFLEGVAPTRSSTEDTDGDGITDLTLKFDRQEIVAALEDRLTTPVAAGAATPVVTPEQVADALFAAGPVRAVGELDAVDQVGNRNGLLDVGDLRALLLPPTEGVAAGANANGRGANGGSSGTTLTLVLTGSLADGVPFMGEDELTIKDAGRAK